MSDESYTGNVSASRPINPAASRPTVLSLTTPSPAKPAAPADDEAAAEAIQSAAFSYITDGDARLIVAEIRRGEIPGLTTTDAMTEVVVECGKQKSEAERLRNRIKEITLWCATTDRLAIADPLENLAETLIQVMVSNRDLRIKNLEAEVERLRAEDEARVSANQKVRQDLIADIRKMEAERDAAISRAKACAIDYNSAIESQVKISERLRYELENMRGYKDACESDLDTARAAHAEAMELLRSAQSIASRYGKDVNWPAFQARVHYHLAKYKDASK